MSAPNPPRTGNRPQRELVPTNRYYPSLTSESEPQTYEQVLDFVYKDPAVAAHYDSYPYRPDIQESVLLDAADEYVRRKVVPAVATTPQPSTKTRSVPSVQPLVFYWHQRHETQNINLNASRNPLTHTEVVMKALGGLTSKQLTQYMPAILRTASHAGEMHGTKLIVSLESRLLALGIMSIEGAQIQSMRQLDLKSVA